MVIIPEPYKVGFRKIASLEESAIEELLSAFRNISPVLFAREILKQVTPQVKTIDPSDVVNITETLFSLYVNRASQGGPVPNFVEDVVQTIQESDDQDLIQSAEAKDLLTRRLSALLGVEPMKVGAKSYVLLFDHSQNYRSARILTDFRPVFGDETDEPPKAAMIIHQLKIKYLEGDVDKELFVAMDNKDIKRLMTVLERAESKAKTLESVLERMGIQYIEPE